MGTQNCLKPRQISEPIPIVLRIDEETKADAIIDLEIYGHLE